MVATQIEARGITDPLVLDAMRTVPRELMASHGRKGMAVRGLEAVAAAEAVRQVLR